MDWPTLAAQFEQAERLIQEDKMSESTRMKFQFPPGQEPELVPELTDDEKCAVFDRFAAAFAEWRRHNYNSYGETEHAFYAGYKAGYGHAKDDAQEAMEKR